MEYVDGTTLEQYARHDQLLPVKKILEIAYKCARALDYASKQGVIHRDIKPANILLAGEADIKISDFGAALTLASQTTQVSGVGSPAYMSPEQVKEQPLTHQTDIFSLGVVMYQLLTGRLPFQGTNNYSMIYQIINTDPAPPSRQRPGIPGNVDAIVMRALSKNTENRYQSWEDFAADLVSAMGGEEVEDRDFAEAEKFDMLRKLDFFQHFSDVELWEVLRLSRWHKHQRDAALIHEGDIGSSFFILVNGEVKVVKQNRLLNVLKAGECFGEMAYLGKQRFHRSASVVALSGITIVEIRAETLTGWPWRTCGYLSCSPTGTSASSERSLRAFAPRVEPGRESTLPIGDTRHADYHRAIPVMNPLRVSIPSAPVAARGQMVVNWRSIVNRFGRILSFR